MFQQLWRVNITGCVIQSPEHDLAEWRSGSIHRHKLRHSNSGREKFGSAYRQKNKPRVDQEPRSAHGRAVKNKPRVDQEPRSAHGRAVNEKYLN